MFDRTSTFDSTNDHGTITQGDWLTGIAWAIARVWVGWQFLSAGLSKVGAAAWTGGSAGAQIRQLLGMATSPKMTTGPHPTVLGPFAWLIKHLFLPNAGPLAYLVTTAEILVGLTLMLGVFTRIVAAGGASLNMLYLLSGSVGVNPPMFAIELAIVLVGTTAGLIGLDYFLGRFLLQRRARTDVQARGAASAPQVQSLRRVG